MHYSAYVNAEKFYKKYCEIDIENKKILDVGSYDVNGTMKPIFQKGKYIGIDMDSGPNVDVVGTSHDIPFKDQYFDIVISSSCFEHDDMFWESFREMCRVLKDGGYMYIQAPQNGPYHGWPGDNWRFYIDSWKALEKWGNKLGYDIELVEHYIDETTPPSESEGIRIWNDSIGIYRKKHNKAVTFDLKNIEIGHHNLKYNNVNILKCPFDYPLYQMIINEVNPDLIIEIGTYHGGNTLYLADLLKLKGKGVVHTIDIKEYTNMGILDEYGNVVRYLGGFENYDIELAKNFDTILVIDDGSHQYQDVKNSLEKFKDIVSLNSYFIVEDGILTDLGYSDGYNGGPIRAIREFLIENNDFVIETKWTNFFGPNYTFNPMGYLKKMVK